MSTVALRSIRAATRGRLGLVYKLAVLIYVLAVVILSYRDGMTMFAKIAGLVLGGLFLLRTIASGERIFLPTEYRLLIAWLLIGIVSSSMSSSPETALARVFTLLQVFPISLVLSNFIVWNGDSRFYWLSIVFAALVSGVVTLANPAQFSDFDGRIYGTLDNANAFAALLAVSIGVCLAAAAEWRVTIIRILAVGLAAFFAYLVTRTGSRMGMLASIAAAVTVGVCMQAGKKGKGLGRAAVIVVSIVAVAAVAGYLLTSTQFADRYAALQSSLESGDFRAAGDTSLYGRALLYRKAFEIFLSEPLLGVGLDVFRTASLQFHMIGNNAHSNYMEILAGTGILGAICYYGMYYVWWSRIVRSWAALRDSRYAISLTIAATLAVVLLVLDVAWVSYYEKLTLMLLAGLIAEANLVDNARRHGGA